MDKSATKQKKTKQKLKKYASSQIINGLGLYIFVFILHISSGSCKLTGRIICSLEFKFLIKARHVEKLSENA